MLRNILLNNKKIMVTVYLYFLKTINKISTKSVATRIVSSNWAYFEPQGSFPSK